MVLNLNFCVIGGVMWFYVWYWEDVIVSLVGKSLDDVGMGVFGEELEYLVIIFCYSC